MTFFPPQAFDFSNNFVPISKMYPFQMKIMKSSTEAQPARCFQVGLTKPGDLSEATGEINTFK